MVIMQNKMQDNKWKKSRVDLLESKLWYQIMQNPGSTHTIQNFAYNITMQKLKSLSKASLLNPHLTYKYKLRQLGKRIWN